MNEKIANTLSALEKNNMNTYFVQSASEVVPLLQTLLQNGQTIGIGGSVSLDACNMLPFLRSGNYNFLDRYAEGLTREEMQDIFRACFNADAYITSSNAITTDGALVNVDGNSNRVAAMAFGPKKVFVIVGTNKIVDDEKAAFERIGNIAAPLNAKRLHCKTPCAVTGKCENCKSPARICCTYVVQRWQREAGRINVIVVNEKIGY